MAQKTQMLESLRSAVDAQEMFQALLDAEVEVLPRNGKERLKSGLNPRCENPGTVDYGVGCAGEASAGATSVDGAASAAGEVLTAASMASIR